MLRRGLLADLAKARVRNNAITHEMPPSCHDQGCAFHTTCKLTLPHRIQRLKAPPDGPTQPA
eukprot:359014-Chlamydomonas_euryale.AAC.8